MPGAPPVPPTPSGGSSLPDLPNLPSRIRPIQDLRKYCQTALRRLEDAPKKHRAGAWLNEDALVRMQSLVTSAAVLEHAHLAMLRLDTHVEGFRAKCPGEGWLDELAIGCETFAQSRERRDFTFRELVLISDKLNRDKRLFYAYFELLVSGVRRRVTAEMSELVRGFIDKLGAVVDEPILRSAVVMLLERITYTTGQHLADVRMEWPRFPGTSKSCQSCGIEILVRAPAPDAARPVVTLLGEHRVPIADGTKAYCLACAVVAYVDHLATIDNVPGGGDSSNASYVQEFDAMIPAIGEAIKKYGQAYHTDDRTLRTKMGAIVEKLFAAGSSQ